MSSYSINYIVHNKISPINQYDYRNSTGYFSAFLSSFYMFSTLYTHTHTRVMLDQTYMQGFFQDLGRRGAKQQHIIRCGGGA